MIGLLEGIRVVETGILLSVDNLGSLLGDAGADVIKVEAPGLGDYLRNIGPVLAPDCSVAHLASNRNKRSVTLDLRTQAGQAAMSRLIATADVFITGNIGDTNRKLGLDDEAVRAIKADIVYCQVTGFGSTGPYADIPTHGKMMDALGGGTPPMELRENGLVETVPGSPPPGRQRSDDRPVVRSLCRRLPDFLVGTGPVMVAPSTSHALTAFWPAS